MMTFTRRQVRDVFLLTVDRWDERTTFSTDLLAVLDPVHFMLAEIDGATFLSIEVDNGRARYRLTPFPFSRSFDAELIDSAMWRVREGSPANV